MNPSLQSRLTPRQEQVCDLIVCGLKDKAIADYLGLSCETVGNHLRNLFDRFDCNSRLELVMKLVSPERKDAV